MGCSIEGPESLLVYEYLPNGSLDQVLFGQYFSSHALIDFLALWNSLYHAILVINAYQQRITSENQTKENLWLTHFDPSN